MQITADEILYALDLMGTAAFAFSGALRALPGRPDIIGMTVLAGATAIGGGAIRDLMLNRTPQMLHDWAYPLVILASALVTFLFPLSVQKKARFFAYFDAVGLGVFSAIGANLALSAGMNPLSVLFIASITGAGGGVVRDVLLNEPPLVLYREVYITAVLLGAGGLLIVRWCGAGELPGFLAAFVITTATRFAAIHWNWALPRVAATK